MPTPGLSRRAATQPLVSAAVGLRLPASLFLFARCMADPCDHFPAIARHHHQGIASCQRQRGLPCWLQHMALAVITAAQTAAQLVTKKERNARECRSRLHETRAGEAAWVMQQVGAGEVRAPASQRRSCGTGIWLACPAAAPRWARQSCPGTVPPPSAGQHAHPPSPLRPPPCHL